MKLKLTSKDDGDENQDKWKQKKNLLPLGFEPMNLKVK